MTKQEIIFDKKLHTYTLDNQKFISVTTKIKDFFPIFNVKRESWKYSITHNIPQKTVIKKWKYEEITGCEFGSVVHDYAECKLLKKNLPKPKTKKEKIYFQHLDDWIKKLLKYYIIIDVEKIIFTTKYKIAGTFDILIQNKKSNQYFICDWKTNKKIIYDNKWQNAINGFENFQSTDILKFQMQLNMYRSILINENYFNKNVDFKMKVLYINHNGIQIIDILPFEKKYLKILFIGGKNGH